MIWPAALLLVGGVCAISSPFNATVRFRIDALSPMVNLTLLSQLGVTTWRYSEELGMIWSAPKLKDSYGAYYRPGSGRRDYERVPSELNFDFVGTGLEIEGQIGAGTSRSVDVYLWIEGNEWASDQYSNLNKKFKLAPWSVNTPYYTLMRETLSDGPWPYHGRLKVPFGLDFRFVCMWFYVPVRTQAPLDILAWQSQSPLIPLVKSDGSVSDAITLGVFSSMSERVFRAANRNGKTVKGGSKVEKDVHGDTVFLRVQTELIYEVPEHTTLVEVLGPVGRENDMDDGIDGDPGLFECYAYLDLQPFWWSPKRLPTSLSLKPQNDIQRTLFLLPVDPDVRYKLHIGPTTDGMRCPVSHIRSYSYYYDYNFHPGSKHFSQPVMIGSVIGSGAGGILLGLITAVFFIRFRRRFSAGTQTPLEVDPNTQPDDIEPFMIRHEQDEASAASQMEGHASTTRSPAPPIPARDQPLLAAKDASDKYVGAEASSDSPVSLPAQSSSDSQAQTSGHPGVSGRRHAPAEHAEDDEDATRKLLPPMYRAEWNNQPASSSQPFKE